MAITLLHDQIFTTMHEKECVGTLISHTCPKIDYWVFKLVANTLYYFKFLKINTTSEFSIFLDPLKSDPKGSFRYIYYKPIPDLMDKPS